MIFELPTKMDIGGELYAINREGDFKMILDILELYKDEELSDEFKLDVALNIFYDFNIPENIEQAFSEMQKFIAMSEPKESGSGKKQLCDLVQDFPHYISAVNKVLGFEARSRYVHWWTFIGALQDIDSECFFAQIINIRKKLRDSGYSKLEKHEKEFYNFNREIVEIKDAKEEEEVQRFLFEMGVKNG